MGPSCHSPREPRSNNARASRWNSDKRPPTLRAAGWLMPLMALALVIAGCGRGPSDRIQGYVEGEFVFVASAVGGTVLELAVERGRQVKRGDRLFRIEAIAEVAARDEALQRVNQARSTLEDLRKSRRPSEIAAIEAQIRQAQIAVQLTTSEWARLDKLKRADGAVTDQALDAASAARDQATARLAQLESEAATARLGARNDQIQAAEAALHAAEAALARAEWVLSQSERTAPDDAEVIDTLYRTGEFAPAGRPVVMLLPPGNVKIRTYVPEGWLGYLHTGDSLRVLVDGNAEPIEAKVRFISPRAEFTPPVVYTRDNREKFVFLVEASVPAAVAPRMHPGQPVDVLLPLAATRP